MAQNVKATPGTAAPSGSTAGGVMVPSCTMITAAVFGRIMIVRADGGSEAVVDGAVTVARAVDTSGCMVVLRVVGPRAVGSTGVVARSVVARVVKGTVVV